MVFGIYGSGESIDYARGPCPCDDLYGRRGQIRFYDVRRDTGPVPSPLLGLIQRRVCGGDDILPAHVSVARPGGYAHACGYRHCLEACFRLYRTANTLCNSVRVIQIRFRKEDGELLTAIAEGHVHAPDRVPDASGYPLQGHVARPGPVDVVECLEKR